MEITIVSEAKTKNSFTQKKLCILLVPNLMIRRPPRSTRKESSAASDVYKRQTLINLKDEHFKLKDKYLNALGTIKNYKINDFIELDRKIRGIDRVLQENFLNTATELRTIFQNQQRVFNLSVSERYSNIKFFLLTLLPVSYTHLTLPTTPYV